MQSAKHDRRSSHRQWKAALAIGASIGASAHAAAAQVAPPPPPIGIAAPLVRRDTAIAACDRAGHRVWGAYSFLALQTAVGAGFIAAGSPVFGNDHDAAQGAAFGLGVALVSSSAVAAMWRGVVDGATHSVCSVVRHASRTPWLNEQESGAIRYLFSRRADTPLVMSSVGLLAFSYSVFMYSQRPGLAAAWGFGLFGYVSFLALDLLALPNVRRDATMPVLVVAPTTIGSGATVSLGSAF